MPLVPLLVLALAALAACSPGLGPDCALVRKDHDGDEVTQMICGQQGPEVARPSGVVVGRG